MSYVRNIPRNVGHRAANVGYKPRRYSKAKMDVTSQMDVTSHMDVASQPVCDALSEPGRHTVKLQHEDRPRLDL